ncbi:MAG: dihydrodipicolinate synthase family protein [Bryobacterales bacterium]|nr:dihydrodipicolinate synthase family protein [Bryobacterales bacterium]
MLPFTGPMAAAVTPSRPDSYQMDLAACLEVIDFLCHSGVRAIALFGATGEFPHFTVEDRVRLAHMAIKRSRVPVIVNATHSCFEESRAIIEHAAANGAAGVMIQPPTYFRYAAPEIRQYFLDLTDEFSERVPVLLYNLPFFNNPIPIEVACELLESGRAAGIKDSSGNLEYLTELLRVRRKIEFPLIVGNDNVFVEGRRRGADGVISGCAAAVPELLIALDAAVVSGNELRIAELSLLLDEFIHRIDRFPGPLGIRECLSTRGLKMGARAIPFAEETERSAAELRQWFTAWLPGMLSKTK